MPAELIFRHYFSCHAASHFSLFFLLFYFCLPRTFTEMMLPQHTWPAVIDGHATAPLSPHYAAALSRRCAFFLIFLAPLMPWMLRLMPLAHDYFDFVISRTPYAACHACRFYIYA